MTLIEDFRIELKNILKEVIKEHRTEGCFKSLMKPDRVISFPNKIGSSYVRALRILRIVSENSRKYLSEERLTKMFDEFVAELKYKDEKEVMATIDNQIVTLFNKVRKSQTERQLFVIPIMRLGLIQDIVIGDTTLTALNETTLDRLESQHGVRLRFPTKTSNQTIEELRKVNNTFTFAIVTVDAPDDNKALEIAVQKVDTCLNVLRLYNIAAPFYVRDEFPHEFGSSKIHANLTTKSVGESHRRVNLDVAQTITLDEINIMRTGGFDIIYRLLAMSHEQLTQMQKDILDAIFWFGNAVKERQEIMRFLKYVIALETLLIPTGEQNKKNTLAKRFTSLIYSKADEDTKKEVFNTMRDLYEKRNNIIHNGYNYIYSDDLNQMGTWTQATIQFLVQHSEKYATISDLINDKFPIDEAFFEQILNESP